MLAGWVVLKVGWDGKRQNWYGRWVVFEQLSLQQNWKMTGRDWHQEGQAYRKHKNRQKVQLSFLLLLCFYLFHSTSAQCCALLFCAITQINKLCFFFWGISPLIFRYKTKCCIYQWHKWDMLGQIQERKKFEKISRGQWKPSSKFCSMSEKKHQANKKQWGVTLTPELLVIIPTTIQVCMLGVGNMT